MHEKHNMDVPHSLWLWGQEESGDKNPAPFLRDRLIDASLRWNADKAAGPQVEDEQPPARPRTITYLGDYWSPTIRDANRSRCNACGVFMEIGEFVVAQHAEYDNGSRVTHYFHVWDAPKPGDKKEF